MNNLKKIIAVVIVFTAIIAFPAKAQEIESQDIQSTPIELVQVTEEVFEVPAAVLEEEEQSELKINLNFNFRDNKANFFKAVNILFIGFSIVFAVMILFIFVGKGIDRMFPYKKEEE